MTSSPTPISNQLAKSSDNTQNPQNQNPDLFAKHAPNSSSTTKLSMFETNDDVGIRVAALRALGFSEVDAKSFVEQSIETTDRFLELLVGRYKWAALKINQGTSGAAFVYDVFKIPPRLSGTLERREDKEGKFWRRCHVLLRFEDFGSLRFYSIDEKSAQQRRLVKNLQDCRLVVFASQPLVLQLAPNFSGEEPVTFKAESQAEWEKWMTAILEVKQIWLSFWLSYTFSGWLKKEGHKVKSCYYATDDELKGKSGIKPKGEILLDGASIRDAPEFSVTRFVISTVSHSIISALSSSPTSSNNNNSSSKSGSKDFLIEAPSEEIRERWIRNLSRQPGVRLDLNYIRREQQLASGEIGSEIPTPFVDFTLARLNPIETSLEVNLGDLKFEKECGRGTSGIVFKAIYRGQQVAVKQILESNQNDESEIRKRFVDEIEIVKRLDSHPNLIKIVGLVTSAHNLCIVTEFAKLGSLKSYLEHHAIDEPTLIRFLLDISSGMKHLHQHNIVHRDLACRNILVFDDCVKITDFGLSRVLQSFSDTKKTIAITAPIRWSSPEMLKSRIYSLFSDVFAFGMTTIEMLMNERPWFWIKTGEVAAVIAEGNQHPIPEFAPSILKTLLPLCWQFEPTSRLTFASLVERLLAYQVSLMQLPQSTHHVIRFPQKFDPYLSKDPTILKYLSRSFNASPTPSLNPTSSSIYERAPSPSSSTNSNHLNNNNTNSSPSIISKNALLNQQTSEQFRLSWYFPKITTRAEAESFLSKNQQSTRCFIVRRSEKTNQMVLSLKNDNSITHVGIEERSEQLFLQTQQGEVEFKSLDTLADFVIQILKYVPYDSSVKQ